MRIPSLADGRVSLVADGNLSELIGPVKAISPGPNRRVRFGSCEAVAAHIAECDRAADRSITRTHGIAVVAGFDEPLAAAVRSTADDADVVRPYDDRANLWPASIRTLPGPIARQIEAGIGNAEDVAHIGATPRSSMSMAVRHGSRVPIMMRGLSVMSRRRQSHGSKRKRRDKQSKHRDLHVVGKETQGFQADSIPTRLSWRAWFRIVFNNNCYKQFPGLSESRHIAEEAKSLSMSM